MSRLYYLPVFAKGNSHLVRKHKWDDVIEKVCLPNIPIMCAWSCESAKEGDVFSAGIEDAANWDEYCNEVTCPTCLKRARDKDLL